MKTKADYAAYEQAVADFHERNGLTAGLNSPVRPDQEAFFSWQPCDCCGSKLGGNREHYRFFTQGIAESTDADICTDCVYYLAYGRLDDLTMMEIEKAS